MVPHTILCNEVNSTPREGARFMHICCCLRWLTYAKRHDVLVGLEYESVIHDQAGLPALHLPNI